MATGICCGCQEEQPLVSSMSAILEMEELGWEDADMFREYGDSIHYTVVPHDFYGQPCDGSGQIPQVVLEK